MPQDRDYTPRKLLQVLRDRFDLQELQDLCFEFEVDYDGLAGEGKNGKARELVEYLKRRGRLAQLADIILRDRSDIKIESLLDQAPTIQLPGRGIAPQSSPQEPGKPTSREATVEPTVTITAPPDSHESASPPGGVSVGMLVNGRYLIEKELGRGGIGIVYLARDNQLLSRPVVIKVLLEASSRDEWLRGKFRQEIEALTRIDHPGVVGVLDAGELPDGKPFLVMQFIEGVTLRSVLKSEGMDLERVAQLIRQIGDALGAAHDKGVVHRDLKPENIMLQPLTGGREQVKLIDFGIAKIKYSQVAESTALPMTAGTIAYMQVPTTGSLFGTVQNDAGTPLANIRISLAFKGAVERVTPTTTETRTTVTDASGRFAIDHLPPGVYELTTEIASDLTAAPLFEPIRAPLTIQTAKANVVNLVLARKGSRVASTQVVDTQEGFKLPLLSVAELQLVTEIKEPVVGSREATLGSSFESERITALPIKRRTFVEFLRLLPGVGDGNGGEGVGSFNGSRATAQNFTLDGTASTDADTALPSFFEGGAVSLDAIREFRVITSNANAEDGRNSGGQVSVFLKRGGSALHGTAYEFFAHNALNARGFFDLSPQLQSAGGKLNSPPLRCNQFGGNISGPIVKDSHFFFAGFEGFRNHEALAAQPRVPTETFVEKLRQQALISQNAGVPGPSPLLVAVFLRGYPQPTRLLPSELQARAEFMNDIGMFDTTVPRRDHTNSFAVRTDHRLGAASRLHLRYAFSDGFEGIDGRGIAVTQSRRDLMTPSISIISNPAVDEALSERSGRDFRSQNVALVYNWNGSANETTEFRFGFARSLTDFPLASTPPAIQSLASTRLRDVLCVGGGLQPVCPASFNQTFQPVYPDIGFGADNNRADGFPYFIFAAGTFANFGVDSLSFPQRRARNTFQFWDTYSIVRGWHTIRIGADIRRVEQNAVSGFSLRPSFIIPDFSAVSFQIDRVLGGQQNFFSPKTASQTGRSGVAYAARS